MRYAWMLRKSKKSQLIPESKYAEKFTKHDVWEKVYLLVGDPVPKILSDFECDGIS